MNKSALILLTLICLTSCQEIPDSPDSGTTTFKEIIAPAKEGGEPNLFVSEKGQAYLSWVEYLNDTTDALLFSRLEKNEWSAPVKVAEGTDWFVNWADFPSMVTRKGQASSLAAHWLQKRAEGTYDYDVRIAQSNDGGKSWSSSFIPHTDGIAAEHGFVTMVPLDNGNILSIWLDGRFTKEGEGQEEGHHGHGGGGAMTLRTAEFDEAGKLYEEAELDHRICDCCQTDAALTSAGPVVVYRDRSEEEIRDISMVRKVNGQWTKPKKIGNDNWKIAGCPVNGPAIAAKDKAVAVAWFTAPENQNQVNVVISNDAGETFSNPIRVDDGQPIGRVDLVWLNTETALVSWVETTAEGGEIRLAKVNAKGKIGDSITADKTSVSRQSGFPILEKLNETYLLAWTKVDSISTIKTVQFQL